MAGSVSQQLEELLNPLPKFADPEDDQEDETKAQVEDRFDEDDDEDHEDGFGLSNLRKHNASLLAETDRRYVGKAVSRKQLLKDMGVSEEEEEEDDEDDGEDEDGMTETKGEEEEEDEDDDDDEEDEDDDEEVESGDDVCDDIGASGDEKQTQDGTTNGTVKNLVSKMKRTDFVCAEKVDLHKLTEGMDDLGESDEDDDDDDDDEDGEEEEDDDDDSEEEETEDENEDQGTVKTFSKEKVDVEVEKGKAVKNQLMLWDQLLEGRIKLQKALATANQLPQPQTFPEFKQRGGAEFAGALKNSHKALKALQRSLLELQDQLLHQNPDTRPISLGKTYGAVANGDDEDDDQEEEEMEVGPAAGSGALKRKLDVVQYPGFMAKRFADFQPYCNGTLQKWHDKTRLTMGKSSKGFGAFERNIVTQVEQVLLDKERLLRRTQTRRTEYRVLGKKETSSAAAPDEPAAPPEDGEEAAAAAGEEQLLKANRHLKDLDEDIFDDDDFYHQLLRELIERKTSAADPNDQVAMGRQWLAIQKLRSKIKKRVDTKASKGRKVRFTIHSKLVNFMAPVDHSPMNDESRTELFRCLFGNNSPLEGSEVNVV
ncbi:Protein AATF [Merluccius polli]|uniref:Protein AATF n=1 Tax=Merluccius polli TaxID=89951 RepID=A0AA47MG72_MERPO|nr:Protein AATF [Merluccius polli]